MCLISCHSQVGLLVWQWCCCLWPCELSGLEIYCGSSGGGGGAGGSSSEEGGGGEGGGGGHHNISTSRHTLLPPSTSPMRESQMSSISSRGQSSTAENERRMRNSRTANTQQDTPPPSPAASSDRASKACCFCWCCCCSCSCLTVKNGDDAPSQSKETKLDNLNETGEPPTLEEIQLWSESFDTMMAGGAGRKVFREFLRSEYSEENMLFWLACEELKREKTPESVEEKARLIYEDYISILSPKEVSLDSRVREIINQNMVEPTPHTFDEAQLQIYTLMHRDSYPRFLNSQIYKRLVQ